MLADGEIKKSVPIPTSWRHPVPDKKLPGALATNTISVDQDPLEFNKNAEFLHYTRQLARRAARHTSTQNSYGEKISTPTKPGDKNDTNPLTMNPFSFANVSAAIVVIVGCLYIFSPEHPFLWTFLLIALQLLHSFIRFAFIRFKFWEKRLTPDRSCRARIAEKGSYFDAFVRIGPSYRRSETGDELPPMNDHGINPEPVVTKPSEQRSFYANTTMTEVYFSAYSRPGLSLADFMRVTLTVGLEFRANAIYRCLMYDFGLGRMAHQVTNQRVLFDCALSTSLACYSDPGCNDHLVYHNFTAPYRTNEKKCFDLVIQVLDYENCLMKCVVTCEKADPRRGEVIPPPNALVKLAEQAIKETADKKLDIPASGILELNTSEAEADVAKKHNLDPDFAKWPKCHVIVSIHEMGVWSYVLIAWLGHVTCHWLASGVGDAISRWPLARLCNETTQYFNSQSTFSSHIPMGNSSTDQLYMLAKNPILNGLPIHNHLSKYATKSKLRRMSGPARQRLRELWPDCSHAIIESVLAATLFHAVDHHYTDLTSFNGVSASLENDFTGFRLVLVGPCKYHTRKLLVRQHLDDPVCKIIHECAHKVDPYFADECLFLGICN